MSNISAMFEQVWADPDFRREIEAQEVATDLALASYESRKAQYPVSSCPDPGVAGSGSTVADASEAGR